MKMKLALLLLGVCFFNKPSLDAQQTGLPFSIEIEDVTPNNWPGLHSFAFAEWEGFWVVVGGRTNGLHGFFLATGFPVTSANDAIWILNPQTGDVWTYDVNQLPDYLAEVLRSTNPQYLQKDDFLYFVGGYGKSLATEEFTTFPSITAIDLDVLVPAIMNETTPLAAFEQLMDDRMKVCGGEMHELGGHFYLVGGNDFSGRYTDNEEPTFIQEYTNQVRRFDIAHDGGSMSIENYTVFEDQEHYHRRDFSLAPVIFPDGNRGLGWYGGVFRRDANLPYEHPIYIREDGISVDLSYAQKMSHYTCPLIPIYDGNSHDMYSVFFGGISWHYYDHENQVFVKDDLVPFIDDITTLVKRADGSSTEIVLPIQLDQYLGANAVFIPNHNAPFYDNEVLQLHNISERTLIGHIYGGIHAQLSNFTPSSASNRVFAVYLTPSMPLAVHEWYNSFAANCQSDGVELNWSTSSDLEMDYFEVEHANNLQNNWTSLKKIKATTAIQYTWTDRQTFDTKTHYYRLKHVQKNGSFYYSQVIKVICGQAFVTLSIQPNPVRDMIVVEFSHSSAIHHPIAYELTNMYGQVIQAALFSTDMKLDVGSLNKGVYQIRLKTAQGVIGQGRFLKI